MTFEIQVQIDPPPGIREVLARNGIDVHSQRGQALLAALVSREDTIADILRLAGVQFGLEPAIVAEVLTEIGVGTPPSTQERVEIHNQFHATIERLRREFGGPTP